MLVLVKQYSQPQTSQPYAQTGLMHKAHKTGNTPGVSRSSSDWLNSTGFPGDVGRQLHISMLLYGTLNKITVTGSFTCLSDGLLCSPWLLWSQDIVLSIWRSCCVRLVKQVPLNPNFARVYWESFELNRSNEIQHIKLNQLSQMFIACFNFSLEVFTNIIYCNIIRFSGACVRPVMVWRSVRRDNIDSSIERHLPRCRRNS